MSRYQRPLTVVFGFLGAKPRYVKKYADLVRNMELDMSPLGSTKPVLAKSDVIEYQPKTLNFFRAHAPDQASEEVLTIIDKRLQNAAPIESANDSHVPLTSEFRRRPVIFYLLSNNGAFTFAHFLQYVKYKHPMSYTDIMAQTTGIVWDSAPCYPSPALFTRGFVSVARGLLGMPPAPEDKNLTPIFMRIFEMYFSLNSRQTMATAVTDALRESVPPHLPQLYMISQADNLVFASETYAYVAEQRARVAELFDRVQELGNKPGATIVDSDLRLLRNVILDRGQSAKYLLQPYDRMAAQHASVAETLRACESSDGRLFVKDFIDSPHVDHMRKYPQEYEQTLKSFLEYSVRL